MSYELPPIADPERLQLALMRVPARHREDAVQEAWLAHLEGRNVLSAVRVYARGEKLHELREVPHSQLAPDET